MADSQTKTGREVIGSLSKEMLLVAYDDADITRDYKQLRERLEDPNTSNRDFAMLLRLAWDFRLPKPKQAIGLESDMPIQITINEGFTNAEGN
jgi:hypothetical protein